MAEGLGSLPELAGDEVRQVLRVPFHQPHLLPDVGWMRGILKQPAAFPREPHEEARFPGGVDCHADLCPVAKGNLVDAGGDDRENPGLGGADGG